MLIQTQTHVSELITAGVRELCGLCLQGLSVRSSQSPGGPVTAQTEPPTGFWTKRVRAAPRIYIVLMLLTWGTVTPTVDIGEGYFPTQKRGRETQPGGAGRLPPCAKAFRARIFFFL